MSLPEPQIRIGQDGSKLSPAAQAAIVAAVATGRPQHLVAKDFGVHRNTVSTLCRTVRKLENGSNPLSHSWKEPTKLRAIQAVNRGLESQRDPYKAANIGLEILYGLGDLQRTPQVQVDNNMNVMFAWQAPQDTVIIDQDAVCEESNTSRRINTLSSTQSLVDGGAPPVENEE